MDNWLKTRLSPVKSETPRWTEFAETIQQLWEENFDPLLARQVGLRSIFTAVDEDKQRILSELGRYYDIDILDDSIPMAVVQRRVELLQKDSLVPLTASIRRACPDVVMQWRPLYAITDREYIDGEFYTEEEILRGSESWEITTTRRLDGTWTIRETDSDKLSITITSGRTVQPEWLTNISYSLDGSWAVEAPTDVTVCVACYMTSRGKLYIDEANVTAPELIESTARARVALTKPLHIVFDGLIWSIVVEFPVVWGDTTDLQVITSRNTIPVFCCYLILDGTWEIDGSRFMCSDNGDIKYRYPVSSGPMHITAMSEIQAEPVVAWAVFLDGSWQVDGSQRLFAGFGGATWKAAFDIPFVYGDTTAYQSIISQGECNCFSFCTLMLDGTWEIDGSLQLCFNQYRYPVLVDSMITAISEIQTGTVSLFAAYLDGSLYIDGTWDLLGPVP